MPGGLHDLVFPTASRDIRYALDTLNATGGALRFECYDTSHLYNLHYFPERGLGETAGSPDMLRAAPEASGRMPNT